MKIRPLAYCSLESIIRIFDVKKDGVIELRKDDDISYIGHWMNKTEILPYDAFINATYVY